MTPVRARSLRRLLLPASVVALAFAAGCSDDDDDDAPTTPVTTIVGDTVVLDDPTGEIPDGSSGVGGPTGDSVESGLSVGSG